MKPTWRVVGASAQGTSHQKHNKPCQDAYAYAISRNSRAVILAVADGAGSANKSDKSARLAAKGVSVLMKRYLTRSGIPPNEAGWNKKFLEIFSRVRQRIVKLAEEENATLADFHTTLACAVVSENLLAVAQVGDNIVVAQAKDGLLFAATQPRRGEHAEETYFLTMENSLQHVETRVYFEPICSLTMMSDGLLRLALSPNKEPYAPFFQPILAFVNHLEDVSSAQEQLRAFLESDRVCARTDDDKTLVIASFCFPD